MKQIFPSKTEYTSLLRRQNMMARELEQLKTKMTSLGSLRWFEELTRRGREFAKNKGIKVSDVIQND